MTGRLVTLGEHPWGGGVDIEHKLEQRGKGRDAEDQSQKEKSIVITCFISHQRNPNQS